METTIISTKQKNNNDYKLNHCNCISKICGCEINSPLTKGFIDSLLKYFQISNIESVPSELRINSIHLWGTKDKSSKEIEKWLIDFVPFQIEWISDDSCNLNFDSITNCFRVFENFTDEFEFDKEIIDETDSNREMFFLSIGIWRQVVNLPDGTNEKMFMRIANTNDVKVKGSEKKSQYYLTHGNPRYGNVKGFVSKSYREQLKRNRNDNEDIDSRLVAYDDLPQLNDGETNDKSPIRKIGRKSSPVSTDESEEDNSGECSEEEDKSAGKRRKMISSMRLYSDRIPDKNRFERMKTNRSKGSVHSRLG